MKIIHILLFTSIIFMHALSADVTRHDISIYNPAFEHISTDTEVQTVSGYFLTSKLVRANSQNNSAAGQLDSFTWKVAENDTNNRKSLGTYLVFAYIPQGATARKAIYTIQAKDRLYKRKINQAYNLYNWASLGMYTLNSQSYIKVTTDGIKQGQWLAADALKFVKITPFDVCSKKSNLWNYKLQSKDNHILNSDLFLNIIEFKYPELFTDGTGTFRIAEYNARYYQPASIYLGVKKKRVYSYTAKIGITDYGNIDSVIKRFLCTSEASEFNVKPPGYDKPPPSSEGIEKNLAVYGNLENSYGVFAYDETDKAYGYSVGYADLELTGDKALDECALRGNHCAILMSFYDTCAALVEGDKVYWSINDVLTTAVNDTLEQCHASNSFECSVSISACTNGN